LYCNDLNNKVYCANQGSGTGVVTLIDGATNQILDSILVGDKPVGFGHNRRQNRVYVADSGSSAISVLRDSGAGIEETMNDERGTMNVGPTVVHSVLPLPEAVGGERLAASARLLDVSGRKALDLRPGANDGRALAPGVCFVRTAQAIRKVVVTR